MPMELVIVLKWVKSVSGCQLFILHLYVWRSSSTSVYLIIGRTTCSCQTVYLTDFITIKHKGVTLIIKHSSYKQQEGCGRHSFVAAHSSVVSSAPTILRPRVRIPSTPTMLFSICIKEIVSRK